jgi:hypothetical protein
VEVSVKIMPRVDCRQQPVGPLGYGDRVQFGFPMGEPWSDTSRGNSFALVAAGTAGLLLIAAVVFAMRPGLLRLAPYALAFGFTIPALAWWPATTRVNSDEYRKAIARNPTYATYTPGAISDRRLCGSVVLHHDINRGNSPRHVLRNWPGCGQARWLASVAIVVSGVGIGGLGFLARGAGRRRARSATGAAG